MKKGIGFKIEDGKIMKREYKPLERVNKGKCFYCENDVLVGEGQVLKYKVITTSAGRKEYPTHKKCRKLSIK